MIYDESDDTQNITRRTYDSSVYERIINDILELTNKKTQTYEVENLLKEEQVSEKNYVNVSTYKLSSQYNFYTDFFEQDIANEERITERMIPNFYVLGDKKYSDFYLHKQINSLNDNLNIEPNPLNNEMEFEYFDQYSNKSIEAVRQEANNPALRQFLGSQLEGIFSNILISNQYLQRLKEVNNNQYLVPFCIKLNFKNPDFGIFSSIINDVGLSNQFLVYLRNLNKILTREEVFVFIDDVIKEGDEYRLVQQTNKETVDSTNFADTADFVNYIKNYFLNDESADFYLGLAENQKNVDEPITADLQRQIQKANKFKNALLFKIFVKRLNDYFNNNKPSILQFFSSEKSPLPLPTEIIGYELLKKETAGQETTIQTFSFSPVPTIEEIEYIDSQVKYGKTYKYELYSYNLTTKMVFDREVFNSLNITQLASIIDAAKRSGQSVDFDYYITKVVSSYSGLKRSEKQKAVAFLLQFIKDNLQIDFFKYVPTIFKRKVFSDLASVFDNPPPSPEIEIDGMMGVDNKVFIRLQSSISEFKAKPILIQPDDEAKFSRNIINQKLENIESEMMFDGDDRIQYFQIFKLDHHPKSYQDFKDKYVQVSTTHEIVDPNANYQVCDVLKTNHTSYLDTIESNKKYYYTFRSIDIHGNISNPGPIYEVEIVNAEGTIFTLVKVVDLLKKEDKQSAKSAKRFLYILPTAMQTLINERQSGYFSENGDLQNSAESVVNSVKLGLTDEKIWNKNFRLKIRSKTTGKTVEIDFKFIHEALTKKVVCK